MNFTIAHPEFKTQLLELRVSGLFCRPVILLNGVPLRPSTGWLSGVYLILNDAGQETRVTLNSHFLYKLPRVLIELDEIKLNGKADWKQFAGWKKTVPSLWFAALLKWVLVLTRIKSPRKSS